MEKSGRSWRRDWGVIQTVALWLEKKTLPTGKEPRKEKSPQRDGLELNDREWKSRAFPFQTTLKLESPSRKRSKEGGGIY